MAFSSHGLLMRALFNPADDERGSSGSSSRDSTASRGPRAGSTLFPGGLFTGGHASCRV